MPQKAKLFQLLSLFSPAEMKKFGLFVSSPYFNRLANVTRLFLLIKKNYPAFSTKELSNEELFKKIFPGERFSDSRIRALSSYLYSLAEKFLASEKYFAGNNSEIDIIKLQRERSYNAYIESSIESAFRKIKQSPVKDYDHFNELYLLQYEKNHLGSYFKPERDFQLEAEYLTSAFLVRVLRLYSTVFNIKSSLNIAVDEELISAAVSMAALPAYKNIPAVKMNFLLYRITRYHDETAFGEFTRAIDENKNAFSPVDLYQSYILLLNFCVIMIRGGKAEYIKIKFELYKKLISAGLWLHEGEIPYVIFNNIVSSANENKEHAYALDFIEKHSHGLTQPEGPNVTHFCYAKTYYSLKDYDKALFHLAKTGGMEDIFYKFAVKDLSIKIFFETSQYESVASLIDTYRHLISKSRIISLDVKNSYRTYLNFLAELIKPNAERSMDEIKYRLKSSPGFVNKDWILKMLG